MGEFLHKWFVRFPVGMLMLCFIGVIFWFQRRQIGHGFFLDQFNDKGDHVFLPCSNAARRVLERVCKGKEYTKLPFGARVVPNADYRLVYELVMHDAEEPQCITMHSKLLNCNITDTP
jgi:hypothetical protein